MTNLDSNGWLSVGEICVYVPLSFAAAAVCIRHGFSRSSGWIFTLVLCTVRILGAIFQLLTYSNPGDTTFIQGALILDSVGLSPLLLATLGLLSRL